MSAEGAGHGGGVPVVYAAPRRRRPSRARNFSSSNESDPNPSWHVDENWSPIGVPGPTDVVCVLEEGFYQLTVTQPVTVAGLRFDVADPNPKVKIIATDFTLNGFAYLGGDTKLKVNGGAVLRSDSSGSIEVHSKLVVEGGTVAIDVELYGSLNWWGTGSVTGTLVTYPGSMIEVEDPELDAHLTVAEGFDLNGSMVFNNTTNQSLTVTSGPLVNTASGMISTRMTGTLGVTDSRTARRSRQPRCHRSRWPRPAVDSRRSSASERRRWRHSDCCRRARDRSRRGPRSALQLHQLRHGNGGERWQDPNHRSRGRGRGAVQFHQLRHGDGCKWWIHQDHRLIQGEGGYVGGQPRLHRPRGGWSLRGHRGGLR